MSLSNTDTEENRKALREWVREQGYDTFINHGYNYVKNVVMNDYEKLKCESDERGYVLKMKICNEIPLGNEFVLVFIPDTKEFSSTIHNTVNEFFSNQTSIGSSQRDETYVLRQIEKSNREYRSIQAPIKIVECFVKMKMIRNDKGKAKIEGVIEDHKSWLEVESISKFTDERQVVVMPFESYMEFLQINDMEKYDQIIEDREQKEKERLGTI